MKAKFINPYTDYGFKKIFGEEASKHFLIDFLNSLLPAHHQIKHLTFKNNEQLGLSDFDRKAIYDIYCENEHGEKFIIELQKAKQNYFKERTVYYATFPITEQAEKGNWNYALKAVYCIGILDFTFDNHEPPEKKQQYIHEVKLKNQNNDVFYDKLTFIYLEMPNFVLQEHELQTQQDKWLFFIKNLEDIQHIPNIFQNDDIFQQAFEKARIAGFDRVELDQYENSLKVYRDLKNSIDTAFDDGKQEGIEEGFLEGLEQGLVEGMEKGLVEGMEKGLAKGLEQGKLTEKLQIAQQAKILGLPIETIMQMTGLTEQQMQSL